jgi:Ca2+-binding RTX toxin-like protein
MALPSETITFAGSGIVFNNTYDDGVTAQVRTAIITAENYLQAHFTDTATVNVTFNFDHMGASGDIANNAYPADTVSFAQLVAAMTAHATTADDRLAVAGLPTVDPSNGVGFAVPGGEAQALGLFGPDSTVDDTVTINADEPWNFDSDMVGTVEHELSEGVFGRVQLLGTSSSGRYTPFDFFRFNSSGEHDYTGGSDFRAARFGVDGAHLTDFYFHDSISSSGQNDGQDLADWDFEDEDAFGYGGGGHVSSISGVDLQALDVLGWTPSGAAPGSGPDDFADSFTDTTHPFGQLTVGTAVHGNLQAIRDIDWFQVTLTAGTDYVVFLTGSDGKGGTLSEPALSLHDATGQSVDFTYDFAGSASDDVLGIFHPSTSGTYYVAAGSAFGGLSGTYTVDVVAGATVSTAGDDVMVGTAAGGTIMAGGGNDTIVADDAPNYLRGEDGNDSIIGGDKFDDINGNQGNDTIDGGLGDDWVVGGKGDDSQMGSWGDDIVWGNLGNDTLSGGPGNDQIRGGQGDDSISGGSGNDYISGDRGNDTESGGSGADMFHTFSGAGIDKVLDFNYAEGDRVMLDPGTTYTASQVGSDTVVDMGNGDQMILVGVTLSTLPSDWIFTS